MFGAVLNVVTPKKLFGANYGFLVVLPWANNRVQGAEDFDSNPGVGLTDMYVQPINLGWHTPRADVTLAYGLYLPTGRYEDGADDNTGLGMWAQEFLAGTTLYLNSARSLHAATTATFNVQSKKRDSNTKVGNILNLEGGVGADFLGGGLTAGLAYYGTFKVSDDQFDSPLARPAGSRQEPSLGPRARSDAGDCREEDGVRLRHGAVPVGTGRAYRHPRRCVEHPRHVPAQAHPPAVA